jgi:hypothetical protein
VQEKNLNKRRINPITIKRAKQQQQAIFAREVIDMQSAK